jgi:hypothetical protein
MKNIFTKFAAWMAGLKNNRKILLALIGLDIFLAVGSNIADWPWLMDVAQNKWYLIPFAPICSLYPLTLAVWFSLYYFRKKIQGWLTTFIFIAITSYGIMAYIYYPFYMSWDGIRFRLVGNMVWVTIYALQSFIIASEIKKIPLYQYILVIGYFAVKDYSDRFLGSFIDILRDDFPRYLIDIFTYSIIVLHLAASTLVIAIPYLRKKTQTGQNPAPREAVESIPIRNL